MDMVARESKKEILEKVLGEISVQIDETKEFNSKVERLGILCDSPYSFDNATEISKIMKEANKDAKIDTEKMREVLLGVSISERTTSDPIEAMTSFLSGFEVFYVREGMNEEYTPVSESSPIGVFLPDRGMLFKIKHVLNLSDTSVG